LLNERQKLTQAAAKRRSYGASCRRSTRPTASWRLPRRSPSDTCTPVPCAVRNPE